MSLEAFAVEATCEFTTELWVTITIKLWETFIAGSIYATSQRFSSIKNHLHHKVFQSSSATAGLLISKVIKT